MNIEEFPQPKLFSFSTPKENTKIIHTHTHIHSKL